MLNRRAWVYSIVLRGLGEPEGNGAPATGESNHRRTATCGLSGLHLTDLLRPISPARRRPFALVPEMPYARENHRHSVSIGGLDDLLIAHRASGLDDGGRACPSNFFDPIREREKCVRGGNGPL